MEVNNEPFQQLQTSTAERLKTSLSNAVSLISVFQIKDTTSERAAF